MGRGVEGTADAIVMPSTVEEVAAVLAWCYENDVPLTARGGGSEGTLGIITAVWLRLVPAPALELPVVGLYRDAEAGISAIERVLASGVVPAAIEYLDGVTLSYAHDSYPFGLPDDAAFMVMTE